MNMLLFLAQVVLVVVLVGFAALIATAATAVFWFAYHMVRDHWTLAQTLHQARARLFHEPA